MARSLFETKLLSTVNNFCYFFLSSASLLDDASQVNFILSRFLKQGSPLVGMTLSVLSFLLQQIEAFESAMALSIHKYVNVQIHITVGVSCMINFKDDACFLHP